MCLQRAMILFRNFLGASASLISIMHGLTYITKKRLGMHKPAGTRAGNPNQPPRLSLNRRPEHSSAQCPCTRSSMQFYTIGARIYEYHVMHLCTETPTQPACTPGRFDLAVCHRSMRDDGCITPKQHFPATPSSANHNINSRENTDLTHIQQLRYAGPESYRLRTSL